MIHLPGDLETCGLSPRSPNNVCEGWGGDQNGQTAYLFFRASAGGAQGYSSIPELSEYNYDPAGVFLNPQQFNKLILPAVMKQKAALAQAIAAESGRSPSEVYAALTEQFNDDGSLKVNGGNAQFAADPQTLWYLSLWLGNRSPGAPSAHLHTNTGLIHGDTMNPYSDSGWGLLVHFFVDVLSGTLFYGPVPIPR